MSVASKTTSKGNLSKAPSTSQIGSKTELKAAENAPAQQKAEAALPTPPPDIDPEILKTMIVIPGLTFITRDEREKMLLEPSVDDYIALVFYLGEKKEEIRQLYKRFPFKLNRSGSHGELRAPQDNNQQKSFQNIEIASRNAFDLDTTRDKDKPADNNNNSLRVLGTLQTEHSQRSISKSPSLYPTYDPATYEGKSDMEIFKAHVDWVAEFLDIPEFKRFDVRRRTGLISFQPLDGKFKDINYDIFQSLLKFICDELVNYKGPKPTTLELLKRRIRKYFTEFVQRHPDMTTTFNGKSLLSNDKLSFFADSLSGYLERLDYFMKFKNLHSVLQRLAKLSPSHEKLGQMDRIRLEGMVHFIRRVQRGLNLPALEDLLAALGAEGFELPPISTYSMEEGSHFVQSINNLYTFRERNRDKINKVIADQFGQSGRTLIPVVEIPNFIKKLCDIDLSLKLRAAKDSEELLTEIPEFAHRVMLFADSYFMKILHLNCELYPNLDSVAVDELMFWQFLELFVQHNNNMVIDYSPNKKFKHLVELKKTIETTLQKFKDSLATCKTAYEKSMLQNTVKTLEDQLYAVSEQIKQMGLSKGSIEHEAALKRIFHHYCQQHIVNGSVLGSFDRISHQREHMGFGDWIAFCRDFGIFTKNGQSLASLTKVFKLQAKGREDLGFEDFTVLLEGVADLMFQEDAVRSERTKKLHDYLELYDVEKLGLKMRNLYRPFVSLGPVLALNDQERALENSKLQSSLQSELKERREKLFKEKNFLRSSSKIMEHTEVQSRGTTGQMSRSDTRGQEPLSPTSRRSGSRTTREIKKKPTSVHPMMRSPGQQHLLELPQSYRIRLAMVQEEKSQREQSSARVKSTLRLSSRSSLDKMPRGSYMLLEKRKAVKTTNQAKVSWQGLQNMNINQIKGYFGSGFDPSDLIEVDPSGVDEMEERVMLGGYQVNNLNKEKQVRSQRMRSMLENYGVFSEWNASQASSQGRLPDLPRAKTGVATKRKQNVSSEQRLNSQAILKRASQIKQLNSERARDRILSSVN